VSKPQTLFDALQIEVVRKDSPWRYLDATLRRARCFVLDEGMSAFMAELATRAFHELIGPKLKPEFMVGSTDGAGVVVTGTEEEVARLTKKLQATVEGLRVLAKAPHAVTWIEFDFHQRYERYLKTFSAHGAFKKEFTKNRRTAYKLCGWLIEQVGEEQYACTVVMGEGDTVEVTPYKYVWSTAVTPLPPLRRFTFIDVSDGDNAEHDRIASRLAFGTPAAIGCCDFEKTPVTDILTPNMLSQVMMEMRGEVRYVWALLASINDLPVGIAPVKRSRGFMARRNYQKFMGYSVITLTLPKRTTERKLARILVAVSRRRAHEVRGHFKRVGKDKVRKWIKEHIRGDASLGWVTHSYKVQHEKEQA
jgi:hypothetical protein